MPMEALYNERNGYWFDPESEIDLARDLAEQFTTYLQNAETKKKKKK
jgi:GAF domain-containing protein